MFTVTSTTTRPDISVSWFTSTSDGEVLTTLFSDTLVIESTTNGEDSLTRITSLTFNSYDDYQSWITKVTEADATLLLKRNNHIVTNSMTLKVEESIDGGTPVIEKLI